MCSIVEDDFGDEGGVHQMIEDPKTNGFEGEICKKCETNESVIKLDFKSSMCLECFLIYIRHKFRATLGSTKIVRRNSKVLTHFNGAVENICLVDMIRYAFYQESHKRLCFDMELIYIDEHCVDNEVGKNAVERFKKIEEVRAVLKTQFPNFPCYYSTIASKEGGFKSINELTIDDMTKVIETESKFLSVFNSLQSLTSKQDFIAMTRYDLLRLAAPSLACQYVFLSDTTLTLATRLLSNMSLGRGSSTAFDVAFCDDRIESLKFVRPIKDLNEVEVESYVKFNNLKCLDVKNYGEEGGQFASVQNLTLDFVKGLQKNFSSTVSTVYRTCSKIAPIEETETRQNRCVMCKSILDYENSETLFAIEFSRLVSESAGSEDHLRSTKDIEAKANNSVNGEDSKVKKNLCQGCRNIFIGLDDDEFEELF